MSSSLVSGRARRAVFAAAVVALAASGFCLAVSAAPARAAQPLPDKSQQNIYPTPEPPDSCDSAQYTFDPAKANPFPADCTDAAVAALNNALCVPKMSSAPIAIAN